MPPPRPCRRSSTWASSRAPPRRSTRSTTSSPPDRGDACGTPVVRGRPSHVVARRTPWLVLVREPDLLGSECPDQPLALGAWVVELIEEDGRVAGDDDPATARLDDHDLGAAGVARRRNEPDARQQLER